MRAAREREFVEFVEVNAARLLRIAEFLLGDRDQSEDLVQTALLKLYRVWDKERRGEPLAYVHRIMVNTRTDWWRRHRNREVVGPAVPDRVEADHAESHARADELRAALLRLSQRERAVLVLRYYEDLTEVATAAALGVTVGTVKRTCARALAKLRAEAGDALHCREHS